MAYIRPFRAWRYRPILAQHISTLISPPFDTVSDKQRKMLYQHPYNSIHLSVPTSHSQATQTLSQWKAQGILRQDTLPTIYVYYQYFTLPGSEKEYSRKGFICFIEATDWSERVVLRHEDTLPHSVQDRVDVLAATQLNASPTHGLYTDAEHQLETLMDKSIAQPIYQVEDYQGVRDVMSLIQDPTVIERFVNVLRHKPIILADGHHRYESSLIYRRQCEVAKGRGTAQGCRFHMMYLTNTEAEDLRILPTHRLIQGLPPLDSSEVMKKTEQYFHVRAVENASDIPEVIAGRHWAFGVLMGEECYKLRLKPEVISTYVEELAPEVKAVDTAVLHFFFIDKVLGIALKDQRHSDAITYERSFAQCLFKVARQEAQLALITNEVSMDQIKQVCYSGHLMPQKSTYFYPKAVGGLVFGSIKDEEL